MRDNSTIRTKSLDVAYFGNALDVDVASLPEWILLDINGKDFRYSEVTGPERDGCILDILRILESEDLPVAGPERIEKWEKGWQENLEKYLHNDASFDSLTPKYFSYNKLRYNGSYIIPVSYSFELDFYTVVRYLLFHKYLANVSSIVDFGCGTGATLIMLSDMFPEKPLIGCDWAKSSQSIIEAIVKKTGKHIAGHNFNMFSPNDDVPFTDGCAVITMHALEQLGANYEDFLNYILAKRPGICLHLEPIVELYDEDKLFDYLAIRYHQKRGYLCGFLTSLRNLKATEKASIIDVRRLYFGSFFHEGYSVVVWRPAM